MANFINDSINFGFGLFAYSREKLEKMVEALVDSGKVEKKEAQNFLHQMIQKGEDERAEVKRMVKDEVKTAMSDINEVRGAQGGITKEEIREIIREELKKQQESHD